MKTLLEIIEALTAVANAPAQDVKLSSNYDSVDATCERCGGRLFVMLHHPNKSHFCLAGCKQDAQDINAELLAACKLAEIQLRFVSFPSHKEEEAINAVLTAITNAEAAQTAQEPDVNAELLEVCRKLYDFIPDCENGEMGEVCLRARRVIARAEAAQTPNWR